MIGSVTFGKAYAQNEYCVHGLEQWSWARRLSYA